MIQGFEVSHTLIYAVDRTSGRIKGEPEFTGNEYKS